MLNRSSQGNGLDMICTSRNEAIMSEAQGYKDRDSNEVLLMGPSLLHYLVSNTVDGLVRELYR